MSKEGFERHTTFNLQYSKQVNNRGISYVYFRDSYSENDYFTTKKG